MQYQGYIAKITNLANGEEIQDWVQECNITLPNSNYISSLEARFQLDEKKLNKDNEVKIEIFDEVGKTLYTLQGKTNIPKRTKSYTGTQVWEYSIKDSYEKLFDRVIPENLTFYDLYMCNTKDKENSLLHKIARALGFQDSDMDFLDCAYDNGECIRVPFVHLEENARWIDKLQSFKEASDGILYAKNGKLFFRPRNLAIKSGFGFDRTNIITTLEESEKEVLQNGIKVIYDRFEKLENQVVFNLQKKIITEPNIGLDTEVPTMRISYITSAVSNPTLTKATGYYFTTEDPSSRVEVALQKDVHYKVESWKETMAEVKFYNPYGYPLYVDNFEIKGVPLSMYEDNEVNVMLKSVEQKYQENFMTKNKNKLVQTSRQSEFLAKKAMRRDILNSREYRFRTHFLHEIEIGGVYSLELEDIHTIIEIKSISINLKTSQFTMDIQADCVQEELGEVKLTTKTAATPKGNYVDLKPLEEKVNKAENKVNLLEQDIRSSLHKMESQPTENVKDNDIWLNPKTNVWKKYYNNTWNPISEKEILPAMKMYNSIETNVIKLQGTTDKVGAYLLNGGEKFGGLNGELAHTTFDKLGQFEAENPNNRVALNIKDPANPSRITSQILLGVTDVKDPKWNDTVFAIGDEASPARIEFKNGQLKQMVNGKELGEVLKKEEEKNYYRGLMATGKILYPDPEFRQGGNSTRAYNNMNNGLVKIFLWEPARDNPHYPPNDSGKVLVIKKEEGIVEPTSGGFHFSTPTRKEAIFITKIVAKIPEGYKIFLASNSFGNSGRPIGWLTSNIGTGRYETYIYALRCGINGNFSTTNFYHVSADDGYDTKAIEWYVAYATVFDCSADSQVFLKETSASIDTVKGALEQGDFTITGRTVFDGSARFVSRGTNEVITIANGAIDFNRDGQRLTRIKNIRYGTVSTDSQGKGVVNFEGFKQPMIVMSSIKSANFGKNMASVFCYAEHIANTQYRFFVGGTNEYWVEASPVKVVGTEWSATNAMNSNLLSYTGMFQTGTAYFKYGGPWYRADYDTYKEYSQKTSRNLKVPRFQVKILRVEGTTETVLFNNEYTISHSGAKITNVPWEPNRKVDFYPIDFSRTVSILKNYAQRTNVKFKMVITILEPNLTVEWYYANSKTSGGNDDKKTNYWAGEYIGTLKTLTMSDFTGLSITASASTSTLGGVTGNGEVSYIAMEID